jgi:hypothetical protein
MFSDDFREPGTSEKTAHENSMSRSFVRVHRTRKPIGKSDGVRLASFP